MNPDSRLLRQWLQLAPEGPWPPTAWEMLGLPPHLSPASPLDPSEIEARALQRLDWLRPYQLKYPELVTEGMNRLAQAFLELTQQSASRKPGPPPETTEGPRFSPQSAAGTERHPPLLDTRADTAGPPPLPEPTLPLPQVEEPAVPAEPAPLFPLPPPEEVEPIPLSPAATGDTAEAPQRQDIPLSPHAAERLPVPPPLPAGMEFDRQPRRALYRRLVQLRRLQCAWGEVGEILANAASLDSPLSLLRFHAVHRRLRESLNHLKDLWPVEGTADGAQAAALLRHDQAAPLLRDLDPEQRLRFLLDWRRGEQYLAAIYQQLRNQLQTERQARRRRRWLGRRLLRVATWPESALILFLILLLLVLRLAEGGIGKTE